MFVRITITQTLKTTDIRGQIPTEKVLEEHMLNKHKS